MGYAERAPGATRLDAGKLQRLRPAGPLLHACAAGCVHLSERDIKMIEGVAAGLTNKAIAYRLGVGVYVVKDALERINGEAGTSGRAAIVAAALRAGIIT